MITLIYQSNEPSPLFENTMRELSGVDEVQCICIQDTNVASGFNKCLKQASFDIIVFLRAGVRICSNNWGQRIGSLFSTHSHGIFGSLGTLIVPISGMLWEKQEPLCGTIWYEEYSESCKNIFGEEFLDKVLDVVALEGSFLAVHRERLSKTFDEKFKGDSFYDVDFCVQNHIDGVGVGVIFGVDILKESFDDQDEVYLSNHKKFLKKHSNLPLRVIPEIIFDEKNTISIETDFSVNIMITNQGGVEALIDCLEAIYIKTSYKNYKITIIDYGSTKDELEKIASYIRSNTSTELITSKWPHNAQMYNEVAFSAKEDLVLFFSKNIVLINDAISLMVLEYGKNQDVVGTIGIRTHLKNHMIRQFGLQLISTETEDGLELGLDFRGYGKAYAYRNDTKKGVMGNSMECMLVETKLFLYLGGFNLEYNHSLQDFEFNLKTILAGRENLLVGKAAGIYTAFDRPRFLPKDYYLLMNFINENIELVTPYVLLLSS